MTDTRDPVGEAALLDLGALAEGAPTHALPVAAPADVDPGPADPRPVLVVGVPRSGTTWVAKVLGHTRGAVYLHEPDNPVHGGFAHAAKVGLGRYPRLRPGDPAPLLHDLFAAAWSPEDERDPERRQAANRAYRAIDSSIRERALDPADGTCPEPLARAHRLAIPRHPQPAGTIVVKSVHLGLCLEWALARWDLRTVAVRRHPLEIVASWLELGVDAFLHDDDLHIATAAPDLVEAYGVPPAPVDDPVARVAWTVGVLGSTLDASARSAGVEIVDHELLCRDPVGEFRWLAQSLDLEWTSDSAKFVADSDRPGRGEETARVAAQQVGRWPTRFDPDALDTARRLLSGFPISRRYDGIGPLASESA